MVAFDKPERILEMCKGKKKKMMEMQVFVLCTAPSSLLSDGV